MKVETKLDNINADLLVEEMPSYSVGVLTYVPPNWSVRAGNIVVRGCEEVYFPEVKKYTTSTEKIRYRPLRPGESVTFKGE